MSQEEKCSKSDIVIGLSASVLVLGVIGFLVNMTIESDKKYEARHKMYREACKTLDAKLGDTVTTKEGPYSESEMTAIKFGEETLTAVPTDMMLMSGIAGMQLRFTCDELKIVKRANDKSEK